MPTAQPPSPLRSHLPAAVLLAATGGMLDAIVYLLHGGVFANAMTGNTIFLGIALVQHHWWQVLRHVAPLCAFLAGVLAARRVQYEPGRLTALLALGIEMAGLFGLELLPRGFPELLFTATVSFVSVFQVTTFRRVGPFSYNSTFVTGNLREVGEGLFDSFRAMDPAIRFTARRKFRDLLTICLAFLAGAAVGAVAARVSPKYALWWTEPALGSVLLLVVRGQVPIPEDHATS